ncbi:MAG: xanthine dehydrogenase family protein subunit M [Thermodesulfobacteriota bacterium]
MKSFNYHEPATVAEVCRLLADLGPEARVLAGGTDLIVKMKAGAITARHVVNLKKAPGLAFIQAEEASFRLGALTTLAELEAHPGLRSAMPLLGEAAATVGSVQIRNVATLGGNLCNASPSADMAPGLLVLGAKAVLTGPKGTRTVSLEDFFLGPGRADLAAGEILTEVIVPCPPPGTRTIYLKQGPRRAMDIAVVGVAVALGLAPASGSCDRAGIALGAVAPTPLRLKKAEKLLVGLHPAEFPLEDLTRTVRSEINPISDVRASREYRLEVSSTLVLRAIGLLLDQK